MAAVFLCGRRPLPPPPPPTAPGYWRDEVVLNRRVTRAAWTELVLSGVLAVSSGVSVGIPYEGWASMAPWQVYLLGQAALLIPGAILVTGVRALPKT